MPSVYLTSIYSLFDLANTQKGQVNNPCLEHVMHICLTIK